MKLKSRIILFFMVNAATPAWSQFSGNNTAEYQLGNIPGTTPAYVNSIYDQLNLEYRLKGFKTMVRLENFYSNDTTRSHYTKFTQYSLMYRNKGFEFKAGNYFETLGKGLLYRGYEIKNSIYEDRIYRVKQGFYRDLRGVFGSYSNNIVQIKALHGKSLINQLPANAPDNRLDLVSAISTDFRLLNQNLGLIALENNNETKKSAYLSAYLGETLFENFTYHGEYAHRVNKGDNFFETTREDSYGVYFSTGYSTNGFGVTLELKDYQNLFIGSGITDPPTLVKEHSYKLLNRSTHVPYLYDETGLQIEVFIIPAAENLITVNHSRSNNELGETGYKSAEYFAEWQFTFSKMNQFKVFADYSFDEILLETRRYATGIYYTRSLPKNWSVTVETEFQQIELSKPTSEKYRNTYTGLILNHSTTFSTALIWEFSNDVRVTDFADTDEVEIKQHYPGISLSFKPNTKNTLQLFAGKRRGGPACTAGICYEVLDFRGIEVRWAIKF